MARLFFCALVILAAGACSGFSLPALAIAALCAAAMQWLAIFIFMRKRFASCLLDPRAPNPQQIAVAFRCVLHEASALGKPFILRISVPESRRGEEPSLEPGAAGDFALKLPGARAEPLGLGRRGIADFPLPLRLRASRSASFLFAPANGGRVRISRAAPPRAPLAAYATLLIAGGCAAVCGWPLAAAACLGAGLGLSFPPRAEFSC